MYDRGKVDVGTLAKLAAGCTDALQERLDAHQELTGKLAALDGATCTGNEWWRDKAHPTKTPKLYILHSVNAACPLHGEPSPGGRLRVYVGSDPAKIEAAREAIAREETRQEWERELAGIQRGLSSCAYYLRSFYGELGYTIGDVGDGGQPRRW